MPERRFDLDDVFALATVADPQWSPDGRLIACVVARPDLKSNRETAAIWLVDANGQAQSRRLTLGAFSDRFPRFSPDGKTLAFISNRSGTDQIWTIPVDGGEASPLLSEQTQNLPWESREALAEHSPITYVERMATPTLIVHGDSDLRVPLAQSQQLHGALKRLGVETEFVLYPREGHGIKEPRHRRDLLRRVGDWLDRCFD